MGTLQLTVPQNESFTVYGLADSDRHVNHPCQKIGNNAGTVISSTLLSLVPVAYEVIDDIELWLTLQLARLVTPREAHAVFSLIHPKGGSA